MLELSKKQIHTKTNLKRGHGTNGFSWMFSENLSVWICHTVKVAEVDFPRKTWLRAALQGSHAAFKFTFKAFVFNQKYLTEDQESVFGGRSEVAGMLDKIWSAGLKVCNRSRRSCVSWETVDVVLSCCGKWHADCTGSPRSYLIRSRIRFLARQ